MNNDQLNSLVRTGIKILSTALAAHGLQAYANIINTPDVLSAVLMIAALAWSHFAHSSPSGSTDSGSSAGKVSALFLFGAFAATVTFMGTGCQSANSGSYQAVSTVQVTASEALKAYDVFAAQGKTSVVQNQQVATAYAEYQAAFSVACDAGAALAAASQTNSVGVTAAQSALTEAESNSTASLNDLVNLIKSFGVSL